MTEVDVQCALVDGKEFRTTGVFEFARDEPEGWCTVRLGDQQCSVLLLDGHTNCSAPLHQLLARAIALSITTRKANALTVAHIVRVTVRVLVCGVLDDLLLARGDGKQVCDPYGAHVEGAETKFQIWRLVRQMLERQADKSASSTEVGVYLTGDTEYCRVWELPYELQRAFGICHAWSPRPDVPDVADACSADDMRRFLDMLRDGRGHIPPTLVRR